MGATLLGEEACAVAVGATKIVQEVKGGVVMPKMVDVVGSLLMEEVETCLNEVAANLRQLNNGENMTIQHSSEHLLYPSILPTQRLRT